MYNTYRFSEKEKDPVIDIARTCVQIFAATKNISFYKAMRIISKESRVSFGCMTGWFYGATRKPYFCSIAAVVYATGRDISIGGHGLGSKSRFRVIKGSKAA